MRLIRLTLLIFLFISKVIGKNACPDHRLITGFGRNLSVLCSRSEQCLMECTFSRSCSKVSPDPGTMVVAVGTKKSSSGSTLVKCCMMEVERKLECRRTRPIMLSSNRRVSLHQLVRKLFGTWTGDAAITDINLIIATKRRYLVTVCLFEPVKRRRLRRSTCLDPDQNSKRLNDPNQAGSSSGTSSTNSGTSTGTNSGSTGTNSGTSSTGTGSSGSGTQAGTSGTGSSGGGTAISGGASLGTDLGLGLGLPLVMGISPTEHITTVCEYTSETISCPNSGTFINIIFAGYGRTRSDICPGTNSQVTNCGPADVTTKTGFFCDRKASCHLPASNQYAAHDPCVGVVKYLTIQYECQYPCTRSVMSGVSNGEPATIRYNAPDPILGDDTATASCTSPYALDGERTATCQGDSTWDTTRLGQCRITCPKTVKTGPGTILTYDSEPMFPGTTAKASCNQHPNDSVIGPDLATCQEDGTWDIDKLGQCKRTCPRDVTAGQRATVTYSTSVGRDRIEVGETATASCQVYPEDRLFGEKVATCLQDGSWDIHQLGECKRCLENEGWIYDQGGKDGFCYRWWLVKGGPVHTKTDSTAWCPAQESPAHLPELWDPASWNRYVKIIRTHWGPTSTGKIPIGYLECSDTTPQELWMCAGGGANASWWPWKNGAAPKQTTANRKDCLMLWFHRVRGVEVEAVKCDRRMKGVACRMPLT